MRPAGGTQGDRTCGGPSPEPPLDRCEPDYRAKGYALEGLGMVVGSLIDPEAIANAHVRIHALEGRLFRGLLERAARDSGLECSIWRERDLLAHARGALDRGENEIRIALAVLPRAERGPWRAEHKAAALAGWLVLSAALARWRARVR